jgi:hypothetical protein
MSQLGGRDAVVMVKRTTWEREKMTKAIFAVIIAQLLAVGTAWAVPQEVKDCAVQAEKAHKKRLDEALASDPAARSNYRSHHNDKLNKCVVKIEVWLHLSGNTDVTEITILDAYERKPIAYYHIAYGGIIINPNITCGISWGGAKCKSEDEFEEITKHFMEE